MTKPPNDWAPPQPRSTLNVAPTRGRRRVATRLAATFALLGVVASGFLITSLALFTDSEAVDDNVFNTGTVDIATTPTTQAFTPGAMAPGDEVTAPIVVTNSGTLELRYAVTSTTTENVLASELQLTVRVGVTDCSVANWDGSGTEIAPTDILGSTTTEPVFGSVAQGAQAGDRTLAPAATETLCLHVTLPIGANNTSQGQTTTATFGFEAEQTANN